MIEKTCLWSTYGNRCKNTFINQEQFCSEHNNEKCGNCGMKATEGCDFCGQFVCGGPMCSLCGACSVTHGANLKRMIPKLNSIDKYKELGKKDLLLVLEKYINGDNETIIKEWKKTLAEYTIINEVKK